MKHLLKLYLFISLIGLSFSGKSQYFLSGEEPFSLKWEQIKTEHFQIIFASEAYEVANKVANLLEYYYEHGDIALDHKPKKVSVILHSHTVHSNGFAAWAPKRMEFYMTPPQDLYGESWIDKLAVHEFRHIIQTDKLDQGVTHLLKILFGEQAVASVSGMLPFWYLEGDAIFAETIYSKTGRGRQPSFFSVYKTNFLGDEKRFSYDQAFFGSYQRFVPNYYQTGYLLTSYARANYGESVWSDVEDYVSKYPYTLLPVSLPFYSAAKKYLGLSSKELYEETMNYLDTSWVNIQETPSDEFVGEQNEFFNYLDPHFTENNSIIAIKRGLKKRTHFVIIDSMGKEKFLYEPGVITSDDISYSNGKLIWSEYKADARWDNRAYAIVRILDIDKGSAEVLDFKSRYFAPSLDNSGNRVALVEIAPSNQYNLLIIDINQKTLLEKYTAPENTFIRKPVWDRSGNNIYLLSNDDSGTKVMRLNRETRTWQEIVNLGHHDVQNLTVRNDLLYYHSSRNGTDNLYSFNISSKKITQLTYSSHGIIDFCISAKRAVVVLSEHTSQGKKLKIKEIDYLKYEKNKKEAEQNLPFIEIVSKTDSIITTKGKQNKQYKPEKYRRVLNLFNFHSWVPFHINYEDIDVIQYSSLIDDLFSPGVMLFSQNDLSTAVTSFGYRYENGQNVFSSSLIYRGFYPVFEINAQYGHTPDIFTVPGATWAPQISGNGFDFFLRAYVPLNLSFGKNIIGLRPSVRYTYEGDYFYNYQDDYYLEGLQSMDYQLLLYGYSRMSPRDLQPRTGLVAYANYHSTPFKDKMFGDIYYGELTVFLPGFYSNHGIKFNLGYQKQEPDKYLFSSSLNFPRGYPRLRTEELLIFRADYVLPLFYPDWSLGSVMYIKRFRASVFYDVAKNQFRYHDPQASAIYWYTTYHYSAGLEINMDYHILRTILPVSTGIRVAYREDYNDVVYELLLGINLNI